MSEKKNFVQSFLKSDPEFSYQVQEILCHNEYLICNNLNSCNDAII